MAWLRVGDNALSNPRVLALGDVAGGDARTRAEVFGFVALAATLSAAHLTDGVFTKMTLELVSPTRWKRLADQAVEAGLLVASTQNGKPVWKLVDDPDLLHVRRKDEVDWERQRSRDNSNPALTVPVRVRDGDACRYCRNVVNFKARTGARRGCYDHRDPGRPATLETYVVSCFSCNSARRDNRADWDDAHPLLAPPPSPFYAPETMAWIRKHPEHVPVQAHHLLTASQQRLAGAQQAPGQIEGEASGRVGTGSAGPGGPLEERGDHDSP